MSANGLEPSRSPEPVVGVLIDATLTVSALDDTVAANINCNTQLSSQKHVSLISKSVYYLIFTFVVTN